MKKILVIGSARSGKAVAKLLVKNNYKVIITDRNTIDDKEELESQGIEVIDGGHPDYLKTTEYSFVVKNPGIPYFNPFVKYFVDNKVKIYTEIEIAYWYAKKFNYGAITGTNGKTTITSILEALLSYNGRSIAAGNIGCPLSEIVYNRGNEELDVALELSNFQLLGIESFAPHVSVICNLAPDHLDYMPTVESYYESKCNIYKYTKTNDYFLRNTDDPIVMKYATNIPCKIIDFSLTNKNVDLYLDEDNIYYKGTKLFNTSILKLVGKHNVCNAMIAACMAYIMGVSITNIELGLSCFKGVEHRLEYIGTKLGVNFYNDSKATNTQAVETALDSFKKDVIVLVGGHDKGIPFDDLKRFNDRVKLCVAFGETRNKFKTIFNNIECVETMEEALNYAIKHSNSGDTILLSPACSSFDQFKNYEVRGTIFKEFVNEYLKK
ncbi:MAG: UDP-N-acetylmuramoyl-L-alanine--D-glutamate ligase [Erysipelotrichaceae bacterium]